ncbi:hypothetical protein NADRNF5_0444 [Nitrosopumilus adriaticus]|uniref:Uncharacterized protein n=1 Tax=Nitrosopumilus adriaticus TaxID=1580092 RepID=A0A0D5C1C7_9ARCH|nr:hypothetical protein NADRNF5_0444 [Nitrosopumilus adriaticus]
MFFISNKKTKSSLVSKEKCAICSEKIKLHYNPMDEWGIKGSICGDCYSKKINEHYPGEHVRVNKHLD